MEKSKIKKEKSTTEYKKALNSVIDHKKMIVVSQTCTAGTLACKTGNPTQ